MAHISGVLLRSFGLPAKPAYFNLVTSSLVVLHSPFFFSFPHYSWSLLWPLHLQQVSVSCTCILRKDKSIYSSARRVCWDALPPGAHSTLFSLGRVRRYITGRDLVKIEGHVTAKTPHPGGELSQTCIYKQFHIYPPPSAYQLRSNCQPLHSENRQRKKSHLQPKADLQKWNRVFPPKLNLVFQLWKTSVSPLSHQSCT